MYIFGIRNIKEKVEGRLGYTIGGGNNGQVKT